jgi:hypothetical protein
MTASHETRIDDRQPPPSDVELLDVAETAAEAMRTLVAKRARRARKRGIALPTRNVVGSATTARSGGTSFDEVDAAAEEIAALCRQAIELKQRLDAD